MKASVGAVLRGGVLHRVVVTERWRMGFHVDPGETLVVLPDVLVDEDKLTWEDGAGLIDAVRKHLEG